MPTDGKLSEVPFHMQPQPVRLGSKKRRRGHPAPPTPPVNNRSVRPKGRTRPLRKKGRTPASSVPKPSVDTNPVVAWWHIRLPPIPVYVRVDRSGAYHSYPDFGGPFENLDAIESAFSTYARGNDTPIPSETKKQRVLRPLLENSDGSRVITTSLEKTERAIENVNRLAKALQDKKMDDDENFKYELKDIVHWQLICEHPHARYYHLNITMTTEEAGDDASSANLFFAEVTFNQKDKPGYFLSSFCRIEPDSEEFYCHGCMNNGSTDMKHPTSHFDGGLVNIDFPFGYGPCNDVECCDPQLKEYSKEEEELRKKDEERIIESYDYLDDEEYLENLRDKRAQILALQF